MRVFHNIILHINRFGPNFNVLMPNIIFAVYYFPLTDITVHYVIIKICKICKIHNNML